MSTYAFDPAKWGVGMKETVSKVLPVIVVDNLTERIDADKELKQYNIHKQIEIYTIFKAYGVWCLQHGGTRQTLPCGSAAEEMALWLKAELENPESEMIPTPRKGYRPVLCLFGALWDSHLPMFREGRTGKMHVLTDVDGPTLPKGKSVSIRQFYRNVDDGSYGPYHDKVVFSPDGSITIEGCEADYTPELGLAVAACLSTGCCTLSGTV